MIYALMIDGKTVFRTDADPSEEEIITDSEQLSAAPTRTQRFCWEDRIVKDLCDEDSEFIALEQRLLDDIEARRILLSGKATNVDPTKQIEYLRKGAEALSDVGPWPWLAALAVARGTTLMVERQRVVEKMESDDVEVRLIAISATAHAAKDAVMEATTAAGKVAAYDAVAWPFG